MEPADFWVEVDPIFRKKVGPYSYKGTLLKYEKYITYIISPSRAKKNSKCLGMNSRSVARCDLCNKFINSFKIKEHLYLNHNILFL